MCAFINIPLHCRFFFSSKYIALIYSTQNMHRASTRTIQLPNLYTNIILYQYRHNAYSNVGRYEFTFCFINGWRSESGMNKIKHDI